MQLVQSVYAGNAEQSPISLRISESPFEMDIVCTVTTLGKAEAALLTPSGRRMPGDRVLEGVHIGRNVGAIFSSRGVGYRSTRARLSVGAPTASHCHGCL